jgi:hypothetical protein
MNKRESKMEVYPTYTSKPYQGWRNRETWIVAASIRNDENLRDQVNDLASLGKIMHHRKVEKLAGRLEKAFPIVHCGAVDWAAIADNIIDGEM